MIERFFNVHYTCDFCGYNIIECRKENDSETLPSRWTRFVKGMAINPNPNIFRFYEFEQQHACYSTDCFNKGVKWKCSDTSLSPS